MKKESYQKIHSFLNGKNGITQLEKDVVIRKVLENYYANNEKKEPSGNWILLSDEELTVLENSIITDANLENYLDSAKTFIATWEAGKESLLKKHINTGSFWKSVGANIFSSFVYSLLLILLFLVAKDQISGWLQSLGA